MTYFSGCSPYFEKRAESNQIPTMCGRRYQEAGPRAVHLCLSDQGSHQGQDPVALPSTGGQQDRRGRKEGQGVQRGRMRHGPEKQHRRDHHQMGLPNR